MSEVYSDETFFGSGDEPKIVIVPAEHHGKMPLHSHQFYEIVYVADGFTLHSCDGNVQLLVTGDLFFIRPGEVHTYINAYQAKIYNCLFKKEELGFLEHDLAGLPGLDFMLSDARNAPMDVSADGGAKSFESRVIHASLSERRSIETDLERLKTEREERLCGWRTTLRTTLAGFLVRYARMVERQTSGDSSLNGQYYAYVYKILEYINSHYTEDIGMADLADATGISRDYLTRKFRLVLGMSPLDYLRTFRLSRSMELLSTTDLTVAEIVRETGFSNPSVFTRTFKEAVGITPASYRKTVSGGAAEKE